MEDTFDPCAELLPTKDSVDHLDFTITLLAELRGHDHHFHLSHRPSKVSPAW